MKTIPRLASSALGALCLATSLIAGAQSPPTDPYAAVPVEKLYDEAASEMEAGNFASACPKLEAVTRLAPEGVGARITLGECYEGWGKLASAWSQYVAAEAMATKAGQADRQKKSAAKATEIKPRLATLTIVVPDALRGAPGLTVFRDGAPLNEAQFGAALPVDKGTHEIAVSATGKPTWKSQVDVPTDGLQARIEAHLGAESLNTPPVPTAAPTATATAEPTSSPPPAPAEPSTWRPPIAFAAIGFGLVAAGIGLELRNQAKDTFDASNAGHCTTADLCDADGLALRDDALSKGNGATAAVIVGGALAVGGIVLIFTDLPGLKSRTAAPKVGITTNGFVVKGSF